MVNDIFICHASEDKEVVARPLAVALSQRGLRIWYDEFSVDIGDSLMEKIDQGLQSCRFGAVILSPTFFAKEWPKRELAGLTTRETASGQNVILPIWHEIFFDEVAAQSPILADKRAMSTSSDGIEAISDAILRKVAGLSAPAVPASVPKPERSGAQDEPPSNVIFRLTEFSGAVPPFDVAVASDGSAFVTDSATPTVLRIHDDGTVEDLAPNTPAAHIFSIAEGPDGSMWTTEWSNPGDSNPKAQRIGRIGMDSSYEAFDLGVSDTPRIIAAGTDDAMWFSIGSRLGRIAMDGTLSFFSPPVEATETYGTAVDMQGSVKVAITGAGGTSYIGSYDPKSGSWNLHELPDGFATLLCVDGLQTTWFTQFHNGRIGSIRPSGELETFEIDGGPFGLAPDDSGGVWVSLFASGSILQFPAGAAVPVRLPRMPSEPGPLALSPSGSDLWVTEQVGRIARLSVRPSSHP